MPHKTRLFTIAALAFAICTVLPALSYGSSEVTNTQPETLCRQPIPVLMYHEIGSPEKSPGHTGIPLSRFKEQIQYLDDSGYVALSLSDLIEHMRGTTVSPRGVVITFDDGWKSQLQALPVLRKHNFKAAFFVFPEKGIGDLEDYPTFRMCS